MSRRMVIRCDECGKDENMVQPHAPTSATVVMHGGFGAPVDLNPKPPAGWFKQFHPIRMYVDLCSAECVATWNEKQKGVVYG